MSQKVNIVSISNTSMLLIGYVKAIGYWLCLFSYAMLMRSLRYLHCRAAGIVLIFSVRLDSQRGIQSVTSVRLVLHSELKVHDLLYLDENNKGRKMNTHKVHKSIFSYQSYFRKIRFGRNVKYF